MPKSEFAVVVFIVGVFFCIRVSNSVNKSDLPTRRYESVAFGNGDRVVNEEDKVSLCAGFKEALG